MLVQPGLPSNRLVATQPPTTMPTPPTPARPPTGPLPPPQKVPAPHGVDWPRGPPPRPSSEAEEEPFSFLAFLRPHLVGDGPRALTPPAWSPPGHVARGGTTRPLRRRRRWQPGLPSTPGAATLPGHARPAGWPGPNVSTHRGGAGGAQATHHGPCARVRAPHRPRTHPLPFPSPPPPQISPLRRRRRFPLHPLFQNVHVLHPQQRLGPRPTRRHEPRNGHA